MKTLHRAIPHLFAEWDRIARRIRRNKRLVLFLDFDGTLARLAPMPEAVRLEEGTRDILERLARHSCVTLAAISGRERQELQRHIGVSKMKYLGLYGWESDANKRVALPVRAALVGTLLKLQAELRHYPGVWIEPKHNSFSVHLMGAAPQTRRRICTEVQRRVEPMRDTLRVMTNLRDLEVAPVLIGDKGSAVRKFLGQAAMRGALPVYFGDDLSDEPAFAAAQKQKGISILVGKRRMTRARFSLRGPAEVAAALSRMEELIP